MRTYVLLFIILVIGISCKDDEVKENEQKSYIYAKQMYYSSAVVNIRNLEERQKEIQASSSTTKLINEQKSNALRIEKLYNLIDYLLAADSIKSDPDSDTEPDTNNPIPMPPDGCFHHYNCLSKQNITGIIGLVLQDDIKVVSINLNGESENIMDDSSIKKGANGQKIFIFGNEFSPNITKMNSTISIKGTKNIVLETPIVFE